MKCHLQCGLFRKHIRKQITRNAHFAIDLLCIDVENCGPWLQLKTEPREHLVGLICRACYRKVRRLKQVFTDFASVMLTP
jgi:hypothetical protein